MSLRSIIKSILPQSAINLLRRPTAARRISNAWLRDHCKDIEGDILSIGSGNDDDREGGHYRDYFPRASSYTTSEPFREFNCDLLLDVRNMPEIKDETYDGIYCSGVLEHVDDFHAGLNEMTRILKPGGFLMLGLPFRQQIHMEPYDFWRFTEHGIRFMLKDAYEILEMTGIDARGNNAFPASYWVKARKNAPGS